MKRRAILAATALAVTSLLPLAFGPPATANDPPDSFSMGPPNTAEDVSGNTIRVSGSGSFDPAGDTVVAHGSFTRFNAAGAVIDKGTWEATNFVSFDNTGFGGPSPGFQGGILIIEVTLFPRGGTPETGVTMTITCCVSATGHPHGCIEGITVVGTSVGDFTTKTGGLNLFHLTP